MTKWYIKLIHLNAYKCRIVVGIFFDIGFMICVSKKKNADFVPYLSCISKANDLPQWTSFQPLKLKKKNVQSNSSKNAASTEIVNVNSESIYLLEILMYANVNFRSVTPIGIYVL